jgi:hypothetical protein
MRARLREVLLPAWAASLVLATFCVTFLAAQPRTPGLRGTVPPAPQAEPTPGTPAPQTLPQDRTPQVEPRAKVRVPDGAVTVAPHLTARTCMVQIAPPVGATELAVGHSTVDACANEYGASWTLKTVSCYADAGSPTVTVRLKTGTTLTQAPIPCGDKTWQSAPVVGAPMLHSFSGLGSTCAEPPCDLAAATVTTVTGVSHWVVLRLTGQL